jgi:prostaglandin-endoperoxide synthase 2
MSTLTGVKETLPRLVGRIGLKPRSLPEVVVRQMPRIIEPLASLPPLRRLASKLVINYYSYATALRPRALTLGSDYTTWTTLTDRRFTGRHLPPADPDSVAALPNESDVTALYRRGREVKSTDTSVWFMFFAQWFTDSFLRTSRADFRQNTSTQEIDLCQIYGLGPEPTRMLRSLVGGRLKSQRINGEEFPVFLFQKREPGWRSNPSSTDFSTSVS